MKELPPLTLNSAPLQLGAGSHPAPAQLRTRLRPAELMALMRPCWSPPGGALPWWVSPHPAFVPRRPAQMLSLPGPVRPPERSRSWPPLAVPARRGRRPARLQAATPTWCVAAEAVGGSWAGLRDPHGGGQTQEPPPPMPSCFAVTLAEPLALLELWPLALGARQPGRAGLLRRVPAGARWVLGGLERGSWGGGPIQALSLFVSPGLSRGPSPVVLGSQDALPVATAFTEYVHAYFKGRDADRYGGPGGVGVWGTPPLPQSPRPAWGIR